MEFNGVKYRLYIKDLTLFAGRKLSEARFIKGKAAGTLTNDAFNFVSDSSSRTFRLEDTQKSNKLFPLPHEVVTNLANTSICVRETKHNQSTFASAGVLKVDITGGEFYQDAATEYIVVRQSDQMVIPVTSVAISTDGSGSELDRVQLTLGGDSAPAATPSGNHTVTYSKRKALTFKKKTILRNQTTTFSGVTAVPGDSFELDKIDIVNLVSIVGSSSGDLLESFVLDAGRTETSYEKGKIICTNAVTTSQNIVVTFDSFRHDDRQNDCFSVESFNIADTSSSTQVTRTEIPPTFIGSDATDYLDFRTDSPTANEVIPDPNSIAQIGTNGISFIRGRSDIVGIDTKGKLVVISGDSGSGGNEQVPVVPDNVLKLYDLELPPFVHDVLDIEIQPVDNSRYTMKDIGKLKDRIENLEYYTSLSLLESSAQEKQIFDSAGARFKNGILVDDFSSHSTGDVTDPGYLVSVDPENGVLRPPFTTTNLGIQNADMTIEDEDPTVSNSPMRTSDMIRMKATSFKNRLVHQPFASETISVNPFDVASWVGTITLSPKSDEWRSVERRPEVITNLEGSNDGILEIMNERLASEGIRWNNWQTTWTSTSTRFMNVSQAEGRRRGRSRRHTRSPSFQQAIQLGAASVRTTRRRRWWRSRTRTTETFRMTNGRSVSVSRGRFRSGTLRINTTNQNQVREGFQRFARFETQTESLGDRVIDTSFVPFIRSRKVYFRGEGLKPNTEVFPFFDGTRITGFTQSGPFREFRSDSPASRGVNHTDQDSPSIPSTALVTDSAGTVTGHFVVPNTESIRFRTGERTFRLTSSPTDNIAEAESFATTTYTARGLLNVVQEQIVSTQQVVIDERRVTDSRVVSEDTSATFDVVRFRDPLAQTFLVDIDQYPNGVFLRDVEIYFSAKHGSLPVEAQIVTVENGIPTQKVVPGSRVIKAPSVVNTSADASDATEFSFDHPIHLNGGQEYAVVLLSNSADYRIWVSNVGGSDVTPGNVGARISKNPYTGVFLKSQNASTWTPDQNKDFKFTLNYMKFSSSQEVSAAGNTQGAFNTLLNGSTVSVDSVCLFAETIEPPGTSIDFKLTIPVDGSDETFSITPNETYELGTNLTVDAASKLKLSATLNSDSDLLTPMFDITRTSFLTMKNLINNGVGPDSPGGESGTNSGTHGVADTRYISRMVNLDSSASQVNVFVDVFRPTEACNVFGFVRFQEDGNFVRLQNSNIPVGDSYNEVEFNVKSDPTDSPNRAPDAFDKFQLKFVMTSNNTAVFPSLNNLRAIATS